MNTLYYALIRSEFNKITSLTHKGTNQVKEYKIDILVLQYELFKMLPSESITSMFIRITTIINSLDALEAKDLTKISLEELISSLMTHKIAIENQEREENPKKNLAFKIIHYNDNDDDKDSDDSNPSSSDEKEFMANMCFMAIKNKNELQSLDDESDPTYDELHDAFESLYDEFKKLAKNVLLTKEI
uniref:UBN2 domain-containing protein n=1 Tax=Populus trichocarpa TaxID=3694 RepID=A0A2K1YGD8_POPTR